MSDGRGEAADEDDDDKIDGAAVDGDEIDDDDNDPADGESCGRVACGCVCANDAGSGVSDDTFPSLESIAATSTSDSVASDTDTDEMGE